MKKFDLRKYFITGIILLVPLWITVYVTWLFIKLISNLASPLVVTIMFLLELPREPVLVRLISFLLSIIFICLLGGLANTIVGRHTLKFFEQLTLKIPILSEIYISMKKLVKFFTEYRDVKGNKVVIVEYPRKGTYSIGIVTIETDNKLGVFVPSTPNPTTGYLIFVEKNEIINTTLTVEEALRIVVSGGIASGSEEIKKYL
ncbi:MAG: DUF502 domain-containing protein [Endomicrobia bacterium]|nr:DUF502 domain-containing protein [Endomicrobiia bacterium]MCX7940801.1 DUF502 domain-containing protein [Endomicrobiia bacterium]MDW8056260.1 DUF502 domain-containing protein [Elusimicrobiota bacterium]